MKAKTSVCVVVMCAILLLASFLPAMALEMEMKAVEKKPLEKKPHVPTFVSSCYEEITADAKISDSFINSHPGVTPRNYNEVKLHVYYSFAKGDVFECQYGSGNSNLANTIFNLVYSFPCKNAVKGGTSYQHSYTCTK